MRTPPSKSAAQAAMGARLRLVRTLRGLTQEALGEIMGAGNTAVQAWEAGRNAIDPTALGWAMDVLGCTTDFIIRDDISGVPFDLAVQIQQARRGMLDDKPRRGRPPQSPPADAPQAPAVRDVPDAGHAARKPPGATLHDERDRYIPPPKPRGV